MFSYLISDKKNEVHYIWAVNKEALIKTRLSLVAFYFIFMMTWSSPGYPFKNFETGRTISYIGDKGYNFEKNNWRGQFLKEGCFEYCLIFDVNITVISKNVPVGKKQLARYKSIIATLNQDFKGAKGQRLAHFRLKSFNKFESISGSECELLQIADERKKLSSKSWQSAFNGCENEQIKNKNAINILITNGEKKIKTNLGSSNPDGEFLPLIVIDYRSAMDPSQNLVTQQLGKAFGLKALCFPNATKNDSTNIMATSQGIEVSYFDESWKVKCPGSSGLRNQGLTAEQMLTVIAHIKKFNQKWNTTPKYYKKKVFY
ncbi:MAG: hypothetical protein HOE90_16445 [Bacteriovoracaceae bacterium]|jgi:hypothetical protein|nr:hypothetical protein [Bacteriovoracaceae bacterium]